MRLPTIDQLIFSWVSVYKSAGAEYRNAHSAEEWMPRAVGEYSNPTEQSAMQMDRQEWEYRFVDQWLINDCTGSTRYVFRHIESGEMTAVQIAAKRVQMGIDAVSGNKREAGKHLECWDFARSYAAAQDREEWTYRKRRYQERRVSEIQRAYRRTLRDWVGRHRRVMERDYAIAASDPSLLNAMLRLAMG